MEKARKILFVCHGNICRSTMAQQMLQHRIDRQNAPIECDSAAVSREEIGNRIYPPAKRTLEKHGIEPGDHRARLIRPDDYVNFDEIIYMDRSNRQLLDAYKPRRCTAKIHPLLEDHDVADPWYTGDFEETYRDITKGLDSILPEN